MAVGQSLTASDSPKDLWLDLIIGRNISLLDAAAAAAAVAATDAETQFPSPSIFRFHEISPRSSLRTEAHSSSFIY